MIARSFCVGNGLDSITFNFPQSEFLLNVWPSTSKILRSRIQRNSCCWSLDISKVVVLLWTCRIMIKSSSHIHLIGMQYLISVISEYTLVALFTLNTLDMTIFSSYCERLSWVYLHQNNLGIRILSPILNFTWNQHITLQTKHIWLETLVIVISKNQTEVIRAFFNLLNGHTVQNCTRFENKSSKLKRIPSLLHLQLFPPTNN